MGTVEFTFFSSDIDLPSYCPATYLVGFASACSSEQFFSFSYVVLGRGAQGVFWSRFKDSEIQRLRGSNAMMREGSGGD
jgi:hypothetical protein